MNNRSAILMLVLAAHALMIYGLAGGLSWFSAIERKPSIEIKLIEPAAAPEAPAVAEAPAPPAQPQTVQPASRKPPPPSPMPAAEPQTAQAPQPSSAASPAAPAEHPGSVAQPAPPSAAIAAAPEPRMPVRMPAIVLAKDCAKPEYPRKSYRYNEEGTVTLALLIGADGHVIESRVEKSSGFKDLDNAALAALSLCKFKPGTVDGKPEQSWARLHYQWKLE